MVSLAQYVLIRKTKPLQYVKLTGQCRKNTIVSSLKFIDVEMLSSKVGRLGGYVIDVCGE
jgi:hypothetical protein